MWHVQYDYRGSEGWCSSIRRPGCPTRWPMCDSAGPVSAAWLTHLGLQNSSCTELHLREAMFWPRADAAVSVQPCDGSVTSTRETQRVTTLAALVSRKVLIPPPWGVAQCVGSGWLVGAEANAPIELRPEAANWLAGPVSPAKADLRGTQDPPEEPSWHWLSTVARSE